MKATLACLGLLLAAGSVSAQGWGYSYFPCNRLAPDACGPGYWCTNNCGMPYGPSYCLYPAFPPYNGERPCLPGKGRPAVYGATPPAQGPAGFPNHPYARSPRDFFMVGDP